MKAVIAILGLLASLAGAAEDSPAKQPRYVLEHFQIGYSAGVYADGFPLGRILDAGDIAFEKGLTFTQHIEREAGRNREEAEKRRREARQVSDRIQQVAAGTLGVTGITGPGEQTQVSARRDLDFPAFTSCARAALPLLKTDLARELRGENPVSIDLDADRGDAEKDGPMGLACGKFLGSHSIVRPSLREEIKILSALSARAGAEQLQLLEIFVRRHHPVATSTEQRERAFLCWNRLSALAALTTEKLPTCDSLVAGEVSP